MRLRANVALLLLSGCGGDDRPATGRPAVADAPARAAPLPPPAGIDRSLPPEVAAADGPNATAGAGAQSYDHVGLATWYGDDETDATTSDGATFDPDAIAAAHRTLPVGSIAEVTALDTGRTILVRIADRGPHDPRYEIDLTRGAAALLGATGGATPVRVRAVAATPADAGALARGEPAAPRMDAPPALLTALRRQLGGVGAVRSRPAQAPAPARSPSVAASATRSYAVQVAAFSTEDRARTLARSLGGSVQPAGTLWRVRLGPFGDLPAAQRARDAAARRGYGDAQIVPSS